MANQVHKYKHWTLTLQAGAKREGGSANFLIDKFPNYSANTGYLLGALNRMKSYNNNNGSIKRVEKCK